MALEDELNGHNDIAQFLEKFKEQPFTQNVPPKAPAAPQEAPAVRPAQYARSFEKLEQKIHELEEKFEASTTQNQLILSELARTREVVERQKGKDAFLEHLSRTIATLRTSVENLSQAQQTQSFAFREAPVQRSFDPLPGVFAPVNTDAGATYAAEQEAVTLRRERDEQTRLFNSLRQKASQLKAVNSALDREIKKAQQEKLDALKKSADQAKEILSLRDQLNAAEERFKAFNFEGRIISIKKEYQQKVTRLETQLKEMSDTCMKQVEEIESLKAENTKLQAAAAQKESLQAQLADKDAQLQTLKDSIAALQSQHSDQHAKQLATFTAQLRTLEEQRDRLAVELEQSQIALETIRREKELLEKNFKELVVKINDNDAVIGQLKQKIEVLGQQNTLLTQHNEELAHTNTALSQDNKTLSQTNVMLTQRNAALAQHNTSLTQQTRELQTQRTALSGQVETLQAQRVELTGKVEQLQVQRTQLTERMANLTTKQAQLAQQVASAEQVNKELEHTNQHLEQANEQLNQTNQTLAQTNKELEQTNKDLEKTNKDLAQTNEKLEQTNQDLLEQTQRVQDAVFVQKVSPTLQEPEELVTAVAPEEKQAAELVLATPQQQVEAPRQVETAQPSAALLAARVIERHAQQAARASEPTQAASLRRPETTMLHSLQRPLVSSATEEEWEVVSAPVLSKTAQTIESTDDLPEIKVADPIPQEELYNGEDFLEKTGSFIGRIKWSIFRENR